MAPIELLDSLRPAGPDAQFGDFSRTTWQHVRGLWNDLRPEVRDALRTLVEAGLENLEDALPDEIMPPCEARFVRFVARLVDEELVDRVQGQMRFTMDAAWDCDYQECTAFASRVSAGVRRFQGRAGGEGVEVEAVRGDAFQQTDPRSSIAANVIRSASIRIRPSKSYISVRNPVP